MVADGIQVSPDKNGIQVIGERASMVADKNGIQVIGERASMVADGIQVIRWQSR